MDITVNCCGRSSFLKISVKADRFTGQANDHSYPLAYFCWIGQIVAWNPTCPSKICKNGPLFLVVVSFTGETCEAMRQEASRAPAEVGSRLQTASNCYLFLLCLRFLFFIFARSKLCFQPETETNLVAHIFRFPVKSEQILNSDITF